MLNKDGENIEVSTCTACLTLSALKNTQANVTNKNVSMILSASYMEGNDRPSATVPMFFLFVSINSKGKKKRA